MTRFFVPKQNIGETVIRVTDRDDVHHAKNVLRLREGEKAEVSDNVDTEYLCEIDSVSSDELTLRILEKGPFKGEPSVSVTLFQGYPKADKLESIIQKTTELGVKEIVPVYMERSVVRDNGKGAKKNERFQKIADSAAKQSKRGIIPDVREATRYGAVLDEIGDSYDLVLICYEDEKQTTLKQVLKENTSAKRIAVVIGPEGGLEPSEVDELVKRGGKAVTLGGTILRTETAGPAAVAMILYELEMEGPGEQK